MLAYFSDIASAIDLPLFLYDNPVMTKNHIHPETVAKLRDRIPHLAGIKVSNQDFANLQTLVELMRADTGFSILTGSEFLIVAALQLGCHGSVGGLHNICPHIGVELYKAFRAGDLETARSRQQTLINTWQIFRHGAIWGAFDEALRWLNICQRATAAPYITALSDDEQATVRAILETHVRPYITTLALQ